MRLTKWAKSLIWYITVCCTGTFLCTALILCCVRSMKIQIGMLILLAFFNAIGMGMACAKNEKTDRLQKGAQG